MCRLERQFESIAGHAYGILPRSAGHDEFCIQKKGIQRGKEGSSLLNVGLPDTQYDKTSSRTNGCTTLGHP